MRKVGLAAVLAVVASVLSTLVVQASPVAGGQYTGQIANPIDSRTAYVGQSVQLTRVNGPGVNDGIMYGTVSNVVHAGQGRRAQLQITFHRLVTGNATYAVDGVVTSANAQTKTNVGREAVGAVAGMLVGNAIGKTVFHTGLGGLLGAAGGFLIARNNRQDLAISKNSTVNVKLLSSHRQSSH
ncbi:MAG: hypothetical protein JO165_05910 [Candidatus Eremiobacteraeota bacterium]|nr:hypothetical protein [Candidatus Eremiobacteraeota bacterium]